MIRYAGTAVTFPPDDIDPEKKEKKEWGKRVADAIWSRFSTNATYWGYDNSNVFTMYRSYLEGRQDNGVYKDWFTGATKDMPELARKNFARKGYANVDFRIVSYAPKVRAIIQSILSSSDYKVEANSLNPQSIAERKTMKWRMFYEAKFKQLKVKAGLPVKHNQWEPQNEQELELYDKLGGFKLAYETAIEDIAQHTFDISSWSDIRTKSIDDLIECNFICGKQYVCQKTGATKIKHIAPKRLVMAWVDDLREKAPNFIGHLEKYRLAEIRNTLVDEGYSEEKVREVAKTYFPSLGLTNTWEFYDVRGPVTNRFRWEDFEVDVLEFEYLSNDLTYYTGRETKDGKYIYDKDTERKEKAPYADGRKRKTDIVSNMVIYEGKYILGTQFLFDYGRQKNIVKETKDEAKSSYFVERVEGMSITERCLPLYDATMHSWLKLQAAVWAAAPKGFAIDVTALQNISLGDGVMKPLDLIQIRRQNGTQLYKSSMVMGKVVTGASSIQELEGGLGKQAAEWTNMLEYYLMKILDVAGITQALAASPNVSSEKGLGVSQLEVDATNNALFPLKDAMVKFKEKAARVVIAKTILNIRFDQKCREYYEGIIGRERIEAILSVGDTTLEQLAIKLEALPSQAEKMQIIQSANESKKVGKSGGTGITESDYQFIVQLITQDQVKLAAWYLSLSEERQAQRKALEAAAMLQEQSAAQAQAAIQVEQAKMQAAQMLAQVDVQTYAAKANVDLMKEMKLKQLEGQIKTDIELIKGEQILEQIQLEATLEAQYGNEISGKV